VILYGFSFLDRLFFQTTLIIDLQTEPYQS